MDPAEDLLARTHALLDVALRDAMARLDDRNAAVCAYHLGIADAGGAPARAGGGKSIRAALALASAEAVGSDAGRAVPAAVGIELIHQYSLLHDDIIDEDIERRHRPTAWTVFGVPRALLAGDALAALAVELVQGADDLPGREAAAAALSRANRRMVAGQAADIAFEDVAAPPLADCLAMVADKTGALIECAATVGALALGGPGAAIDALAAFGRHLGLAFQLVDDLMGLWGTTGRTGKPVGADVTRRKKSLPVVAALAARGPDADRLAAIYGAPEDLTETNVAEALDAIEAAGGRAWAESAAEAETEAALAALAGAPIDAGARAALEALTVMLCHRDH